MLLVVKNILKKDNGQALVLVALGLTVFLGFAAIVVDYGYLAWQKRELQNAADAAALAAAIELPDGDINGEASKYTENNIDLSEDATMTVTPFPNIDEVYVRIEDEYETFFAKSLGINSKNLWAEATARKYAPWYSGLLPFGSLDVPSYYPDITLEETSNTDKFKKYLLDNSYIGTEINLWEKKNLPGNFELLDLGEFRLKSNGTYGGNISDVLEDGIHKSIINANILSQPGNHMSILNSNSAPLETRLLADKREGYILAILPSVAGESQGRTTYAWGEYLVIHLKNINVTITGNGNNQEAKLTGIISGVYDIYNNDIPDVSIGDRIKFSKLVK